MLNINDLELRHKKYKRKYYAPLFTMIVSTAIIAASITWFFVYNQKNTFIVENKIVKEPIVAQKIETEPVVEEKNESTLELATKEKLHVISENAVREETAEEKQEKLVLSPSLGFMSKLESKSQIYKEPAKELNSTPKPKETPEQKRAETVSPKIENKQIAPKKEEIEEITINTDKKSSINIARKDEIEDIAHVLKRFNVNHNPALSLFVAKKYYQLGDYEQAYNYALITNDINNNIEDSWLIFSKSLVKLNKKELALETLKKYISHSHSSQARQLLEEIQTGKFK
ncbi:hypothetical protein [Sulfurimonas sp.]|uniref:tetratricopeptide repeat protein n=1 Tax=Sulfurimonas sp. TaxID=2022749 RepID=UPI0025F476A4|nr:hypothetical protein [Sulfurimonas sp.]MBW6488168.1 CDC27 family protein [Sulfurimonas sp.]